MVAFCSVSSLLPACCEVRAAGRTFGSVRSQSFCTGSYEESNDRIAAAQVEKDRLLSSGDEDASLATRTSATGLYAEEEDPGNMIDDDPF